MNFNFFFQLTFFLKLLANFIPRIKFFQGQSDKNWFRKLGRTRVMQQQFIEATRIKYRPINNLQKSLE